MFDGFRNVLANLALMSQVRIARVKLTGHPAPTQGPAVSQAQPPVEASAQPRVAPTVPIELSALLAKMLLDACQRRTLTWGAFAAPVSGQELDLLKSVARYVVELWKQPLPSEEEWNAYKAGAPASFLSLREMLARHAMRARPVPANGEPRVPPATTP